LQLRASATSTGRERDLAAQDRDVAAELRDREADAHDDAAGDLDRTAGRRAQAAKDREDSGTDELTGVRRRGAGLATIRREIDRARRTRAQSSWLPLSM